jgi:hypothetical protein
VSGVGNCTKLTAVSNVAKVAREKLHLIVPLLSSELGEPYSVCLCTLPGQARLLELLYTSS